MGGRKGFTLTELLVCVALMAVLLALCLPLIGRLRGVAMNTVCTSRLRDLTVACNLYRIEFEQYPKLGPGRDASPAAIDGLVNLPQPQEIDRPFLNALARYLNVLAITPDVAASELPPMLQCPTTEAAEPEVRDALLPLSYAESSFYTGYAYLGRVDEQPPQLPGGLRVELLRPERAAIKRNTSAVLWADDVHWSLAGGGAWSYGHRKASKRARRGPLALTMSGPDALGGQHRAFTEGHVEWVPAETLDVDQWHTLQDRGAALRIEPIYYLWF
jgi:prepilin-type N-terminal cleavage/methylation domain-containing protein